MTTAEILELLAWAEEEKRDIEYADWKWWVGCIATGDTMLDTLRWAREKAKLLKKLQ